MSQAHQPNKSPKAYIGLLLMTSIVGFSFIFLKIGLRHTGAMHLMAYRFTAATISLFILWVFGIIKIPPLSSKKAKPLLILSLFYPLLFFTLQTFGMEHSTASEAGIIFATVPVLTLLAARIFLKEKTTILQKTGITLSIAGILFIIYHTGNLSGDTTLTGILLLLMSVLTVITYYILGKKISVNFSAIEITVWMTILAFLVFNGWSMASHIQNHTLQQYYTPLLENEFLWAVLYLGVLSSMLTSFLTNYALRHIPASQIAVFNNLSPVIAIVGGVLLLNENLFTYHIIGGLLVLTGVAMTVFFKNKDK
ncbi:Permease of the drug/metabolite transporter (DMT) superfamily [Saccharicrinis carchari]|uniref:Permease of the drug/metabolite transporter (DMT) superfamily n=1 Tax=Saccharicrinis carchari TaxID=1168039 RepID=A0A521E0X3_SACCC|nr:DMT family transporter [Saccharicrinis carchari]SMO77485.1 Permease of the drug/metabolite transporter (DMT) superfamily [Saccharicrinis carchari]